MLLEEIVVGREIVGIGRPVVGLGRRVAGDEAAALRPRPDAGRIGDERHVARRVGASMTKTLRFRGSTGSGRPAMRGDAAGRRSRGVDERAAANAAAVGEPRRRRRGSPSMSIAVDLAR